MRITTKKINPFILNIIVLLFCVNAFGQEEMFDDFNYSSQSDSLLSEVNNWIIIDGVNGPPEGAIYDKEKITFYHDPNLAGNILMGLETYADGNPENTRHSRIQTDDFLYQTGTFATRIYFDDTPHTYEDGNVETFYSIGPYPTCSEDDLYSEVDFEYLPWNIWDPNKQDHTMYMSSYESCNEHISLRSDTSWQGWHLCVFTFMPGEPVKFYIDGEFIIEVTDNLPESDQNISFANWIFGEVGSSTTPRNSKMQVDWVYHIKDMIYTTEELEAKVEEFRHDTIVSKNIYGEVRKFISPTTSCVITSPSDGSSFYEGDSIAITADANDIESSILKVEFFVNGLLNSSDKTEPYEASFLDAPVGTHLLTAIATNVDFIAATSTTVKVIVGGQNEQGPYGGTAWNIPGTIEAENYDVGGQGISFFDASPENEGKEYRNDAVDIEVCTQGGYNVGWTADQEWLEYTVNVESTGNYDIEMHVASTTFYGQVTLLSDENTIAENVIIEPTDGWQTWSTTQIENVPFTAGEHIFRINIDTGNFNFDKLVFTENTTSVVQELDFSNESIAVLNYPNPFKEFANIELHLAKSTNTKITIYSSEGKKIATLIDGHLSKGKHTLTWDGRNHTSGIYYYQILVGNKTITKKMMLVDN